jgi:hypothetical protein
MILYYKVIFKKIVALLFLFSMSLLSSCKKLSGDFKIIFRNVTPYIIKNVSIVCGAEPVIFDSIKSYSLSEEKILSIGDRETIGPIDPYMSLKQYLIDTSEFEYTYSQGSSRKKLKADRINYISVFIDGTLLPEIRFRFLIEE